MSGTERPKAIGRALMSTAFVLAGLNHFVRADFYQSIMPPAIPWHGPLVALSGYAEIALGLLALWPRTRRLAGWGLIALLVAVFPANLHMAFNADDYAPIPPWLLWARLPFQALFIAWVRWATTPGSPPRD